MEIIRPDFQHKESKKKILKLSDLNEEGEISIPREKDQFPSPSPWQARFLKIMILLLLIVTFVITIFK